MKKKFDWDSFVDTENKICVHCKTEEEANDFCKKMKKHGMVWCDGMSYIENTMWEKYGSNTIYLNDGTFGHISFVYDEDDWKVLEWSGYMKEEVFTKSDLKDGMIVETKEPCLYLVLNKRLLCETSWIGLNSYKDDLYFNGQYREYDITKVYKAKDFNSLNMLKNDFSCNNKSLLELIFPIHEKKNISKSEAEKLLEELTNEEYEIECD